MKYSLSNKEKREETFNSKKPRAQTYTVQLNKEKTTQLCESQQGN